MELVGIDIGGSGIKGARVDTKKGVLRSERLKIPTPKSKKPKDIADTARRLLDQIGYKQGTIGIGIPAVVKDNICCTASNIDKSWIGCNVEELFSDALGHPVNVLNDADAAGIAEMTFGKGKNKKGTIITLTLGTGIGSALFRDGILVPNTEFGHLKYKDSIAEKHASNGARKKKDLSWEEYGKELNDFLQYIDFVFSPNLMIIGGGISKKFDNYKKYIASNLNVTTAGNYNDSGIIGAAMSAYK